MMFARTDRLHSWLVLTLWAAGCLGCGGPAPAPRPVAAPPPSERSPAVAEAVPPEVKIVPHETEIHGRVLVDDYAWLRDRDNPEVIAHLEAENAYTEAATAHLAGLRETLFQEMVGRLKETDLSLPYRDGDAFYYYRTQEGHQYPDFCRKVGSLDAEEEVLLDGDAVAAGHDYFAIGTIVVSPDGRYLAYSYDHQGQERYKVRIRNLETGEFLPDEISDTTSGIEWGNDNLSLYYVLRDAETNRPFQVFRHVLGTESATDELLFHETDESFFASVQRSKSGRFLQLRLDSIATTEVRYLDLDHPEKGLRLFAQRRDGVDYFVFHHGARFFIRTNDGAENFKIMETSLDDTSWNAWREVIGHRQDTVIEEFEEFAGHLALYIRRDGLPRLEILDLESGQTHEVQFPEPTYTLWSATVLDFDTNWVRFRYTSLVTPMSIYEYNMDDRRLELRRQSEIQGDYDPADYVSERIFTTASDGARLPISLVYRKGLVRDGDNPCLLEGYGAYGVNVDPGFSISRLSLLDRGFVAAFGHVRGGGEMGRDWHEQGKLLNKKNTFSDFIAVAEHLIAEGYTSADRLGIRAPSAGGLLVGAVLNQRPDLFAAVIANFPFVDLVNTMLDTSQAFTTFEYDEWGNPNDPEYLDYMLSYSPYDNVTPREYPDVLVRSALNDTRVGYWEQAKWVAKLRAAQEGDGRILLRTDMGGHGGTSGRYEGFRALAFEFTFLMDALGVAAVD